MVGKGPTSFFYMWISSFPEPFAEETALSPSNGIGTLGTLGFKKQLIYTYASKKNLNRKVLFGQFYR